MWSPGMGELVVILLIVLILFGAGKLPQVGRSLGTAISEFKNTVKPKDESEEAAPEEKEAEESHL